jgi:hypothetical protein
MINIFVETLGDVLGSYWWQPLYNFISLSVCVCLCVYVGSKRKVMIYRKRMNMTCVKWL